MSLRTLPKQLTRDSFQFDQVFRSGPIAIYHQTKPGTSIEAWEVVRIRTGKPHPRDPDQTSLVERYPSSESWGVDGWTYLDLHVARAKAITLLESGAA